MVRTRSMAEPGLSGGMRGMTTGLGRVSGRVVLLLDIEGEAIVW